MITQITCRAAHAGLFRFITPIYPYIHQNEFLKEIFISKNKVTAIPLSHVFKNQHEYHRTPQLLAWIRSPPRCASHSMCLKSTHSQDAPPPPLLPAIHFSTKPGGLSRRIPYILDVCGFIPIVPLTMLLWPLHFPQTRSSARSPDRTWVRCSDKDVSQVVVCSSHGIEIYPRVQVLSA